MAEGKDNPPSYEMPTVLKVTTKKPYKKWLFGAVFYAGAVTAALVTVSVLGTLYLNDVKEGCTIHVHEDAVTPDQQSHEADPNTKKTYHLDDNHAECELDLREDKEVIRFSGEEYGNNTMMVLDFNEGICGVHDGKKNVCYLVGGLDTHLPNTTALDQLLSGQTEVSEDIILYYRVIEERPVKNLALLPQELYTYCWGKPVYWLERTQHSTGARKKRRAFKIFIGIRIGKVRIGFEVSVEK